MNKDKLKELITCDVRPADNGKIKISATLKIDCDSYIDSNNIEKYPDIVDYTKRRLKEEIACKVYGDQDKKSITEYLYKEGYL